MEVSFDHIKDPVVRTRVEKAAEFFIESGKDTETLARRLIAKKGKCTIYDFVKKYKWTEGKAQGAIKRLEEAQIIKQLESIEKKGRLKKYYVLRTLEELSAD